MLVLLAGPVRAGTQTAVHDPSTSGQATAPRSVTDRVTDWYRDHLNLAAVALLMTVESSFVPFPSEVVIPPAAYWACQEDSELYLTDNQFFNIFVVVMAGTLGSLLGALINYVLALWLGRPVIYRLADSKIGHFCLLDRQKVERSEAYFLRHGKSSTLIGRFIPAVRQLISIPAGLARMPLRIFLVYTFAGAFLWNVVLAAAGFLAHGQQDVIQEYSHEISLVMCGLGILFAGYLIYKGLKHQ